MNDPQIIIKQTIGDLMFQIAILKSENEDLKEKLNQQANVKVPFKLLEKDK